MQAGVGRWKVVARRHGVFSDGITAAVTNWLGGRRFRGSGEPKERQAHSDVVGEDAGAAIRAVTRLTVNGLVEPMGISLDEPPVFGWALEAKDTGASQQAWRLRVRDAEGCVVWDAAGIGHESQGITYQGVALAPRARYWWRVSVTDERGKTIEGDEQVFGCGLADGTYQAWDQAQWIGAPTLYFDAEVACHFFLEATVRIASGSNRAGIVFGADDHRLKNEAMNVWGSRTRSRFVYEIDVTDPRRPVLNIFVVGMPVYGSDARLDAGEPAFTIGIASALASSGAHGPIRIRVDTSRGLNRITCTVNGVVVDEGRRLNPLGGTGACNTFPNLCKIGFAVPKGQRATYTDVRVRYPGAYRDPYEVGDLFSSTSGATYAIFEGTEGVTVTGDEITVEGVIACADPSFGSAPMLRREFACKAEPLSATLYVAAQGIFEFEVNGSRIAKDFFDCGFDEYATDMPYRAFDVTDLVVRGDNALGAQLAEGWWGGHQSQKLANWGYYGAKQALIALLDIRCADGTAMTIVTDTRSWKVTGSGPVRAASNFHGQRYDARIAAAMEGWSRPGFDDGDWVRPVVVTPRLNGFTFRPRLDASGHAVGRLACVACQVEVRPGSGAYIYDMGENVMGVPEISFPAGSVAEGDLVTIRFAEALYPDDGEHRRRGLAGLMMVENLRAAMATDFYVACAGEQVFCPHFTFHGFRYMEISGLRRPLPKECVRTVRLSSIDVTSAYEGSNALVNRLIKNVSNSQASNFFSIPTDCPQRSERLGWTGDAQVFCAAASLNADVYNFYRNWLFALRALQNGDGSLPNYAPTFEPVRDAVAGLLYGISWDAAIVHIP